MFHQFWQRSSTHGILRTLLGYYLALKPSELRFRSHTHEKPKLDLPYPRGSKNAIPYVTTIQIRTQMFFCYYTNNAAYFLQAADTEKTDDLDPFSCRLPATVSDPEHM